MAEEYIPAPQKSALDGACMFPDDTPLSTWESLVGATNSAGVHETNLNRVACLPGGRTAALLKPRHIFLLGAVLQAGVDKQQGSTPPDINDVLGDARAAAKAASMPVEGERVFVIRAMVDAAASFLWTCPDHGGILHTSSLGILPLCGAEEEDEDDDGASSGSKAGSVVELGTKRARSQEPTAPSGELDALQAALDADELREFREKAQRDRADTAAPGKKPKATSITVETQIQAKMGTLTGLMPQMERIQELSIPHQMQFMQCLKVHVAEVLRLCRLDPEAFKADLDDMLYLEAGLSKTANMQRYTLGVLWLHGQLHGKCGSNLNVDFSKMDKEFTTIKEVAGLPKNSHHATPRGAGLQPVALAPVFQGMSAPGFPPPPPGFGPTQNAYPFTGPGHGVGPGYGTGQGYGQGYGYGGGGPYKGGRGSFGAPGHYGRGGGGRGGGGRGRGHSGPPFCRKCQQAGSADVRHSHTVCPLTICFKCQQPGHTRPNCPN